MSPKLKKTLYSTVAFLSMLCMGGATAVVGHALDFKPNVIPRKIQKRNYLGIKSSYETNKNMKKVHFMSPDGYTPDNHFVVHRVQDHNGLQQGNIFEGNPWHYYRFYYDGSWHNPLNYDYEIGHYHSYLEMTGLQQGHTPGDMMKARLNYHHAPDHVSVFYPNSARVAYQKPYKIQKKNKTITGHETKEKTVGVMVVVSNIQYYQPWRGPRDIVFSRNLSYGLDYNGIRQMNVDFVPVQKRHGKETTFLPKQIPHVTMTFHYINGLSPYNGYHAHGEDISANNMGHVLYLDGKLQGAHKYGAYNRTGESVRPGTNGDSAKTRGSQRVYIPQSHSGIRTYSSHNLFTNRYIPSEVTGRATGGAYANPYSGYNSHSVDITSNGMAHMPTTMSTAVGYGSFNPESRISPSITKRVDKKRKIHKTRPSEPKVVAERPKAQVYPVYKGIIDRTNGKLVAGERYYSDGHVEDKGDASSATLSRPGDNRYAYIITGRFPYRSSENAIETDYQKDMIQPPTKYYTVYKYSRPNRHHRRHIVGSTTTSYTPAPYWDGAWDKTGSKSYDAFKGDNYDLDDNLGKTSNGGYSTQDDSPQGGRDGQPYVNLTNVRDMAGYDQPVPNWSPSGFYLHMNNDQMSQYNNKPFGYELDVNAGDKLSDDKDGRAILLPRITKKGKRQCPTTIKWHNNDPYFRWYNHAHWDANMHNASNFDDHGRPAEHQANTSEEAHVKGSEHNNSNYVPMKIRKIRYHVYHYNYHDHAKDIPKSVIDNNGYNDQFHKHFINTKMTNVADANEYGYMRKFTDYGYQGQSVHVPLLNNEAKVDKCGKMTISHSNSSTARALRHWKFIYDKTPDDDLQMAHFTLNTNQNGSTTMNFYKPYMKPRVTDNKTARLIIDTDKGTHDLPWRFDTASNAIDWVPGKFNDSFAKGNMTLKLRDMNSGKVLYQQHRIPVKDFVSRNSNGDPVYSRFPTDHKARLQVSQVLAQEGYKRGDAVPVKLSLKPTKATARNIKVVSPDMKSKGYLATEDKITGHDFNGGVKTDSQFAKSNVDKHSADYDGSNADKASSDGDSVSLTQPERTIKYANNGNVRVQDEQLELKQSHAPAKNGVYPGTFKTGYGIRPDMELIYRGHLAPKKYGYKGTKTNFAFPSMWASNKSTAIKYTGNNRTHDKENNEVDPNGYRTSQHVDPKDANAMDSLQHKQEVFASGLGTSDLDNANGWSHDDVHKAGTDDKLFDDHNGQARHNDGTFSTDFKFYPRILQRDTGKTMLATTDMNNNRRTKKDDFAGNTPMANVDSAIDAKKSSNGKTVPVNAIFTPKFMPLGNYQTVMQKNYMPDTNKARLGGNWFDYEVGRTDTATAHMYEADNYPNDKNVARQFKGMMKDKDGKYVSEDHRQELSLQPALSNANNKVHGFGGAINQVAHWAWKKLDL